MTFNSFEKYISRIYSSLNRVQVTSIESAIGVILKTAENDCSIWIVGNGGSSATSSHFATDLSRCSSKNGKPIKAISLCDNSGLITAVGNDFSFEEIFVKQLQKLGSKGDLLISISASGNSINLVKAIEFAKVSSIFTLSLVGFDGGALKKLSDSSIHVQTDLGDYGVAEDCHSIICHQISSMLRS
jgi:D-sedoheptulose 7-phosphate isomerase